MSARFRGVGLARTAARSAVAVVPAPLRVVEAARTGGAAAGASAASKLAGVSRAFNAASRAQRTSGGGGGAGGEGFKWGNMAAAAFVAACSAAGGQALAEEARVDMKTAAKLLASSDPTQIVAGANAIHKLASDAELDDPASASSLLLTKRLLLHRDSAVQLAVLGALNGVLGYVEAAKAASKRGSESWGVIAGLAGDAKAAEGVREAAGALLPELALGGSAGKGEVSLISKLMSSKSEASSVRAAAGLSLQRMAGREGGVDAAMLLASGVPAACRAVLSDGDAPADVRVSASKIVASLSNFGGTWLSSAAHRNQEWQDAVHAMAVLASESKEDAVLRTSALSGLSAILASPCGQSLSPAAATSAVEGLSSILSQDASSSSSASLKSAALRAADKAAAIPSLVSGMAKVAPSIVQEIDSDELADAVAALGALERIALSSEAAAESITLAKAIPRAVKAAEKHRATVDIRGAVAGLFEALAFSGSDDAQMMMAHQATPIVVALAKTNDPDMQVRALKILKRLGNNGVNKFVMQKGFQIMHDLVPLLVREDTVQQGIILEVLASLASTDNAYYGENAKALGEARALKPLMMLAKSRDSIVHRNATWALASMTACETNHVPMRACIDTLLLVIERGTPVAQRFAVMAVSNMAATERTREILKEKGAEGILRKCAHNNSSDRMLQDLINKTAMGNMKRGGTQVFNIPAP